MACLLHASRDRLAVGKVEKAVYPAEVNTDVIGAALLVGLAPFVVERHRLAAAYAVHRDRPLDSPQRGFHHALL